MTLDRSDFSYPIEKGLDPSFYDIVSPCSQIFRLYTSLLNCTFLE